MKNIVFISGSESSAQQQWLAILKQTLVSENILLPEQIDESQAKAIDIAIVANPDPKALAKYPNLIWIHSLWAGVERLVADIKDKPIKLVRLEDPQLAKTMAESVLAWTLYLQRQMPEYSQQQSNKAWHQLPTIASSELRVSVLGAGVLGSASLNMLTKLDYQVSCWSRTAKQFAGVNSYQGSTGLTTMLGNTDILVNLLPLTNNTHHLLGNELLSKLPKGAKLINFSRGAVIDTSALLNLLASSHIAHAVLDVFEHEPLSPNDSIWNNPNITVLPHISAPTNMHTAAKVVANNISSYRATNIIPNSVDINQGY